MTKTQWIALCIAGMLAMAARADWPTLRGNVQRTGFVSDSLSAPFRLLWVRHFDGERLGTAMDPIVADGRCFVATQNGNLYALSAQSGKPLWRFHTTGAFLQSPAYAARRVVAANTDGRLYAVDAATGRLLWAFAAERGGFSASPMVVGDTAFIGSRAGDFFAVGLKDGQLRWRRALGAAVRQTAAFDGGRVFVTTEALRVHCLGASEGGAIWTSPPLSGQTARDYYPVVSRSHGRTLVIVRTNPVSNMARRIALDRTLLCRNAGVDAHDWRAVDAWTRSRAAAGSPDLWAKEQNAIVAYQQTNRAAQTFFALDALKGKEALLAPVLWAAGCQGVPAPPDALPDGRLLTLYRTAYGHWSLGVAPLVGLGSWDPEGDFITPLSFAGGVQPPWDTFWGTADESANFVVAGDLVLIVSQDTLSGFNLKTRRLFPICGRRDTFGGFRNLPWARNEWHGPARGGVAVVGRRVYWLTGSRVLCLVAGQSGAPAPDLAIGGNRLPANRAAEPLVMTRAEIQRAIVATATQVLSRRWAPLFVDPGLAGRQFFFDSSADLFAALARAYPHLPTALQRRVKRRLAEEWKQHPPYTEDAWYPLNQGARRELFGVPPAVLRRAGSDTRPHVFGNCHAIWLYATHCHEQERVLAAWPRLKADFEDFQKTGWRLQNDKGALYANRYLASLRALAQMADAVGDAATARAARDQAAATADELVSWWERVAAQPPGAAYSGAAQLDDFINHGDLLFYCVRPQRHCIALWQDLSPGIARMLREQATGVSEQVWARFTRLCPTWPLVREEPQVHWGENFVDTPDFALDAFRVYVWLTAASPAEVSQAIDLPYCAADLDYLTKLVIALERHDR